MTTTAISPADALAAIEQVHDNSLALADPVGAAWSAQMAWMQAVTTALSSGATPAEPSASAPAADTTAEQMAALQEQVTALSAAFQSLEQKLAALFAPTPATPSQGAAA